MRLLVVKGGMKFGAKEVAMKEKPVEWKPTRFYLRCCEERVELCAAGEWEGVESVVLRWE